MRGTGVMEEKKSRSCAPVKTCKRKSCNSATCRDSKRICIYKYLNKHFHCSPGSIIRARKYIPMGFLTPDTLCSNLVKMVSNATLYHFGVLTSNVHNAWVRAVCGRLKSDYRYSNTVVYNNFPWPTPPGGTESKDRADRAGHSRRPRSLPRLQSSRPL